MQAYAQQAKDTELIRRATEIRLRAERRAGEMLTDMAERGERPKGRKKQSHAATLSELGVSKTQSSRWQKLAELNEGAFEKKVEAATRRAVSVVDGTAADEKAQARSDRERDLASRFGEADASGAKIRNIAAGVSLRRNSPTRSRRNSAGSASTCRHGKR